MTILKLSLMAILRIAFFGSLKLALFVYTLFLTVAAWTDAAPKDLANMADSGPGTAPQRLGNRLGSVLTS